MQNWGIDIYAGIDSYSRKIIWIYVGAAGLTQVSVARQFLKAIKSIEKRPKMIRSDRGVETCIMADIQYSLEVHHRTQQNNHNNEANPVPFRKCYLYGKSTTNQRIESF